MYFVIKQNSACHESNNSEQLCVTIDSDEFFVNCMKLHSALAVRYNAYRERVTTCKLICVCVCVLPDDQLHPQGPVAVFHSMEGKSIATFCILFS